MLFKLCIELPEEPFAAVFRPYDWRVRPKVPGLAMASQASPEVAYEDAFEGFCQQSEWIPAILSLQSTLVAHARSLRRSRMASR